MPHLPNLPNAGYSTRRERELTDAIMLFMRDTERDRLRLLTIVVMGKAKWRHVARDIWRGLAVGSDDDALDTIFDYFTLQAASPIDQVRLLKAAKNPAVWRDIVTEIMPSIEAQHEQMKLMDKWGVREKSFV